MLINLVVSSGIAIFRVPVYYTSIINNKVNVKFLIKS